MVAACALTVGGGCRSTAAQDCVEASGARICLSRRSPVHLTASGLEPGSPVSSSFEVAGISAVPQPRPLFAGPDGKFPTAGGVSNGVVIPAGSKRVTITVTVTPAGAAVTTVTFQR